MRAPIRFLGAAACGSLLWGASLARAQTPASSPSPAQDEEEASAVEPASPRAAVSHYLELAREGKWEEAGRYLSLPEDQRSRAPELARRLKAVLDRRLWIDLDLLSPEATGASEDGLPASIDEIGRIDYHGHKEPVRVVREAGPGATWVFSRSTVNRIDRWYEDLPDRWVNEHLPDVLLRPGPKELLWWQWAALLALIGVASLGGRLLAMPTLHLLGRIFSRTRAQWDDLLLERVAAPLTLGLAILVAWLLVPLLELYEPAQVFVGRILRAGGLVAVFWALWRAVDLGVSSLHGSTSAQQAAGRSLVSLAGALAKVLVAALGLVAALSELGYPVAGLLAGLGIGGLAMALAAQKTVENLFGSLSLALDRPFDVGDFVKVEDFVGTVEAIGLRSTRFRTLDRTLITIPNGRVADMRLECFTARDRMRLACTIGVVYETTADQMRQVLEGFERVLRAHPKNWPDAVVVRFKEFAASSLDIEIMAWFVTREWSEFQLIRQEVLIQFMQVVERAGTSIAFPTRTLHLVGEAPALGPGEAR